MATSTLTSKGQITIPVQVRKALGVDAGDRIDFRLENPGRKQGQQRGQNPAQSPGQNPGQGQGQGEQQEEQSGGELFHLSNPDGMCEVEKTLSPSPSAAISPRSHRRKSPLHP